MLLAAADLGCLDEALTVTAMLSCEGVFTQRSDGDRGSSLPDGDGLGDHVMLLQVSPYLVPASIGVRQGIAYHVPGTVAIARIDGVQFYRRKIVVYASRYWNFEQFPRTGKNPKLDEVCILWR